MILLSSNDIAMVCTQQPVSTEDFHATYLAARRNRDDQGELVVRLRTCVELIAQQGTHDDRRAVWSGQVARLAERVEDEPARVEILRALRELVLPCTADERYAALALIGAQLPDAERQAALDTLLTEARAVQEPYDRALALIAIVHVLDVGMPCNEVFGEVLAAIRQVPASDSPMVCFGRAKAIVYRLKRGTRTAARRELERAARSIPDRRARREALAELGR